MGTATAPSATHPAGEGLAGREGPPLRTSKRLPMAATMEAVFEIAPRGSREDVPLRDARRVSAMRRIARAFLAYHDAVGLEFSVTLIVSELITNAIMHSRGTEVGFAMAFRDDALHIAVRNNTASLFAVRDTSDNDEHGRGLQLVAATVQGLGGSWGVEEDGMTVSCHLPVKGEEP